MLTKGNYKVKESRLLVAEDGTTQLELTLHGYPRSFTAQFELVLVESREDRLKAAIRQVCIDYLKVKFNWDVAQDFIELTDTEPEQWLKYIATNAQTDEIELQREDLYLDVVRFLETET